MSGGADMRLQESGEYHRAAKSVYKRLLGAFCVALHLTAVTRQMAFLVIVRGRGEIPLKVSGNVRQNST